MAADRWLLIQMAMRGDGAYINKPYAIFRNENATRKDRIYIYSEDLLKLFRLIEQHCVSRIVGGQKTIDRQRNKMAFNYLKILPMSLRLGYISQEEFKKALENTKQLSRSRLVNKVIKMYSNKAWVKAFDILMYVQEKYSNALFKIGHAFKLRSK